jgi:hypothetical protein
MNKKLPKQKNPPSELGGRFLFFHTRYYRLPTFELITPQKLPYACTGVRRT